MYNGIGLQTARGSGTNGHVQTNKFFIRSRTSKVVLDGGKGFGPDQGTAGIAKKPNKDILEHDRKRNVELKLTILEDKLIDQGYTDAEISEKLQEARAVLEAADAYSVEDGSNKEKNVSDTQTHQVAARKEKQLETMRAALGISLPEAKVEKVEKQQGLADFDVDENDEGKPKNYKEVGSEDEGEYEEGEILHKNDDRKAKPGRQKEDLVSGRKLDKKGSQQGRSRKHDEKVMKRAYSDTESDSINSVDSETDSEVDTKRKHKSQRKSKKSMPYSSDSSSSDSDDSVGGNGRRGREKEVHKHRMHVKSGKPGRTKKHYSDDSDTQRGKAPGSDSDVEIKRKHRPVNPKKIKSTISNDLDYHNNDDLEGDHQRRGSDRYGKSRQRHDSDRDVDSEVEIKNHRSEKAKKIRSNISDDSDVEIKKHRSEREDQRRTSHASKKAHTRNDSDHDSDVEAKRKDMYEKSKKVKSKISDDSDHHSDSDDSDREHQRKSEKFVKAIKRHDSDSDSDDDGRLASRKTEKVDMVKKKGRHDSEEGEGRDEERKDERRNQNDNYYRGKHVGVAEDPEYNRYRSDRQNEDRENLRGLTGSQREDAEYRRKRERVVDDHDYRRHGQDEGKQVDKGREDDARGDQRDDAEYRRKRERAVDDHDYRRHRQDEGKQVDKGREDDVKGDQRRDAKEYRTNRRDSDEERDHRQRRRDEEPGSKGRGRREDADYGNRRHERDGDSSKRARHEDSRPIERWQSEHGHIDEDRWR